jgi:hypothetical protein
VVIGTIAKGPAMAQLLHANLPFTHADAIGAID